MNETFNYLRANDIYSLEDLARRVSEHSVATESLKKTLDEQTARDVYKRQDFGTKLMGMLDTFPKAFESYWPGLGGTGCAIVLIGHLNNCLLYTSGNRISE